MKCIELYIDGKLICRAGDDDIFHMHSNVRYLRETDEFQVSVNGVVQPNSELMRYVQWLSPRKLKIGDEIHIRLVEDEDPAGYSVVTSYGHEEIHGVQKYYCSFCGKEATDSNGMLISFNELANICHECLRKNSPDKTA